MAHLEKADDANAILHTVLVQQLSIPGIQVDILKDVLVDDKCKSTPVLVCECGHITLPRCDLGLVSKSPRFQDGHDVLAQLGIQALYKHQYHRVGSRHVCWLGGSGWQHPCWRRGRSRPGIFPISSTFFWDHRTSNSCRFEFSFNTIQEIGWDEDTDHAENEEQQQAGLQRELTEEPSHTSTHQHHHLATAPIRIDTVLCLQVYCMFFPKRQNRWVEIGLLRKVCAHVTIAEGGETGLGRGRHGRGGLPLSSKGCALPPHVPVAPCPTPLCPFSTLSESLSPDPVQKIFWVLDLLKVASCSSALDALDRSCPEHSRLLEFT